MDILRYVVNKLPSGKRLHNYAKSPCYSLVNPGGIWGCFGNGSPKNWGASKRRTMNQSNFAGILPGCVQTNVMHNSSSGWWFGTVFIFPYIGNNHPNRRTHIFQRGRYTTNQSFVSMKSQTKREKKYSADNVMHKKL